ncbi:hypothetical protein [Arthrobacter sp. Br18]|uniref:hypothetical protein n=1 Tax=Arthrobacter sp. Br18 TaxID=1312954 RepID=UPI00047A6CED|nr:hypothetical protein [Arthrobacter sp. Br18]
MPNESAADPQDKAPHEAPPVSRNETTSSERAEAEDALEELADAPALEEDDDSLVDPESS